MDSAQGSTVATAGPQEVRALVMSRLGEESVMVVGNSRLAVVIRKMIDFKHTVTAVCEEWDGAEMAEGINCVSGRATDYISSLDVVRDESRGVQLLIYCGEPISSLEIGTAFKVWKNYLAPDGRIVMQLQKEFVEYRDCFGEETIDRTIRRYRRTARDLDMRLSAVQGFPFASPLELRNLSELDIHESIQQIRHTSILLRSADPLAAGNMNTTADIWQDRLLECPTLDFNDRKESFLDLQVPFGTFQKICRSVSDTFSPPQALGEAQ